MSGPGQEPLQADAGAKHTVYAFEHIKPSIRRKSPILRKCEDLMETLWNDGYRKQITWNLLRDYITQCCGGFRTTVQDYLGRRAEYYKSRGREGCLKTPAKKGYLEKFGFIEVLNAKILFLIHEKVDREYHRKQLLVDGVSFSLTNSHKVERGNEGAEAVVDDREEREIHNEREKLSSSLVSHNLTAEEQAILAAKPIAEKELPKIKWPTQTFKPQFEETQP